MALKNCVNYNSCNTALLFRIVVARALHKFLRSLAGLANLPNLDKKLNLQHKIPEIEFKIYQM